MQTLSDHLCMHMESLRKCRGHFSLLPFWLRDEARAVLAGEAQVPGILLVTLEQLPGAPLCHQLGSSSSV